MQHVPMPRKVPKSSNVLELRGRMRGLMRELVEKAD